jgi:hypothetical protein
MVTLGATPGKNSGRFGADSVPFFDFLAWLLFGRPAAVRREDLPRQPA